MIRLKSLLLLTRKEIISHIDTPATSIALIVFVLFWEFLFFRNAFLVGEASLRSLYDYLPWLLLVFASAVTMGVFAQEKNEGTLELLLTHPVREIEVILAKLFGSWILVCSGLIFAVPIALTFSMFAPFDWGSFAGQLLASILLAGSLVSLGLFISSVLTSQIASLLATAAISFFFILSGSDFITANLPLLIIPFFEQLSLLTHVSSMARGVIDIRDIWYFISFVFVFVSLTYLMLLKRKFGNRKDYYWSYQIGIALFIGIAVVTNVIGGRIPGRFDLTQGKKYSLSETTKTAVGDLRDIVTITFYASSKLPSQLTPIVRDIKDTLRDYEQIGKGNITLVMKDPSNNPELAQEASSMGVREVQFNVIGQEEFQLKTGFVGISLSYGDKHESIPLIQQTGDLEYQLTSLILKITNKEKKTIAFLTDNGQKSLTADYKLFADELDKQFITKPVVVDASTPYIASEASVLVVAGPKQALDQQSRDAIKNFMRTGKSVLFFIDAYDVNSQQLNATINPNSFSDFIKSFGIFVNNDLVYDVRSNETIRMGQGQVSVLLPYPFWIKALPVKTSAVTNRLSAVTFPWASTLSVDDAVITKEGLTVEKLLVTSPYAGTMTENITISPDKTNFPQANLKEHVLAISLKGNSQSGSILPGKIAVVGDSDFLTDQFVQNNPQNLSFGLSLLSNLSDSQSLGDIRVKQGEASRLIFRSQYDPIIVRYGNLAIAIIIPGSFVLFRLFRRKSLRNQRY